jgi:hypothetical protein
MIKKFKDFKINELNKSTYMSAALKLRKSGEKKRASDLEFWAYNKDTIKFGTFKVNADIYQNTDTKLTKYIMPMNKGKKSPVIEGPIDLYLTLDTNLNLGDIDDENTSPFDLVYWDASDETEFNSISIIVYGQSFEHSKGQRLMSEYISSELFTIKLKVEHQIDDSFILTGEVSIEPPLMAEEEDKILFADANSANNFKKHFLNKELLSKIDGFREFFMEHSSFEEYEKLFKLLNQIPVNQLYN